MIENKYLIIHSEGGHGKQIFCTAFIRACAKQYPDHKLIWVTPNDGPAFGNPYVYRFFVHGQTQYFRDYVNSDTMLCMHDPYKEINHILRKEHITETWCRMNNIEYDGSKPELFINYKEIETAYEKVQPQNGKPILLFQSHGGMPSQQYTNKSWYRDMPMPTAQKLVEIFKHDYRIIHLRTPEQPQIEGTEILENLSMREIYATFLFSSKRILIDSFAQHVAAALDQKSTVLWIGNSPKIFGYEENYNIMPSVQPINDFKKFTYLLQDITGQIQEYPYNTLDIFNIDEIVESVNKQ